jgi:hypothetical protein
MALRIRYQYANGFALGYSIERLGNETYFAFTMLAFDAGSSTFIAGFPEDAASFCGRCKLNFGPTRTALFTDGDHVATSDDVAVSHVVVGELHVAMDSGD